MDFNRRRAYRRATIRKSKKRTSAIFRVLCKASVVFQGTISRGQKFARNAVFCLCKIRAIGIVNLGSAVKGRVQVQPIYGPAATYVGLRIQCCHEGHRSLSRREVKPSNERFTRWVAATPSQKHPPLALARLLQVPFIPFRDLLRQPLVAALR
jgi:hypothetical protein